jgi:hypothetical protein
VSAGVLLTGGVTVFDGATVGVTVGVGVGVGVGVLVTVGVGVLVLTTLKISGFTCSF